jgi:pyruvate/2-oxoglutarate dehydrogenase complex dihydrolipoamide dehydrogenase (E3) component
MFTHAAGYHASVMLRSALFGLPSRASRAIPRVTYTDPELAQVGPTEAEARALHGRRLEVLRFSYAENDRARTELETEGLIKVMVVGGRPVGTGIVGAQAGELIGLWVLAISSRLKISAVAGMIAPYPTLTEISKRAAGQYYVPRLFESAVVRRFVRFVQRLG